MDVENVKLISRIWRLRAEGFFINGKKITERTSIEDLMYHVKQLEEMKRRQTTFRLEEQQLSQNPRSPTPHQLFF